MASSCVFFPCWFYAISICCYNLSCKYSYIPSSMSPCSESLAMEAVVGLKKTTLTHWNMATASFRKKKKKKWWKVKKSWCLSVCEVTYRVKQQLSCHLLWKITVPMEFENDKSNHRQVCSLELVLSKGRKKSNSADGFVFCFLLQVGGGRAQIFPPKQALYELKTIKLVCVALSSKSKENR